MTEGKVKMLPTQHCTEQVLNKTDFIPFIPHFIALSLSTSVLLAVTQMLVLFHKKMALEPLYIIFLFYRILTL